MQPSTEPEEPTAEAKATLRRDLHNSLCKVAQDVHCHSSVFSNDVSMHTLPPTVSFANLATLHEVATEQGKRVERVDYLATCGSDLVFSSNFREAPPRTEQQELLQKHRKRRRDEREDQAERIDQARNRLGKCMSELPSDELDVARNVLVNLVNDLRGTSNEIIVQSFALLAKKLHGTDAKPRVLIAVRLNAGVAVPIALLKRCMGPCWCDGAITTENSVSSVSDSDMPLSEEARASRAFGNVPVMIVTSAPRKSTA
jgi:hypothetical protein